MCVNNILVGLDKVKTQYVTIHTLQKDQKNKKKEAHEDLNLVGNEKVQSPPEIEGDDINKKKTTKAAELVVNEENVESAAHIEVYEKSKKKLTKKASLLIKHISDIYYCILYMIMQQLIMCNLFRIFLLILKKKERRESLKTIKCWND